MTQRFLGLEALPVLSALTALEAFGGVLALTLSLALALAFAFFCLGVLGVSLRSLGDSKVPRQLALPHQQGYSALSFLV